MEDTKEAKSDEQQVLELGIMLGQRRAFGMIAGRCSAAQAECLHRIREERVYLKFAPNWAEYCVPGWASKTRMERSRFTAQAARRSSNWTMPAMYF